LFCLNCFRLISDEIGARNKRPRGRNGAIVGLSFALVYLGLRSLLHANTVASLEAHTIAGEDTAPVARFSRLHFAVSLAQRGGNSIRAESGRNAQHGRRSGYASGVTTLHKPDPSPVLAAAQTRLSDQFRAFRALSQGRPSRPR
jgi:hypothetical protein